MHHQIIHACPTLIDFSMPHSLQGTNKCIFSHVTFDRVTEEALACQHLVLLSKCGITDHMYPPSNHRKSFFAAASYSASAGSACFYMYTHTNTHNTPTRARSEHSWPSIPEKNTSQRPWSNENWVSTFDFCHSMWSFRLASLCHVACSCGESLWSVKQMPYIRPTVLVESIREVLEQDCWHDWFL